VTLALGACAAPAHRAMYYWKTAQGPSAEEIAVADSLGVERLYVRVFDVEADGTATPPLAGWAGAGNREIVPVVYVVNGALLQSTFRPADAASSLLAKVSAAALGPWKEMQVDCDWTQGSRAAYFALLAALRDKLHAQGRRLSATIRLHQVKYRADTGVPPVDRGMLMAYNLLPPDQAGERSSILDNAELGAYLASLKAYPLPLDAALPIFSWVAQWEGERLLGLIDDPAVGSELAGPVLAGPGFRQIGPGRFLAMSRGSLRGRSVEKGDVLVVDAPSPAVVQAAAAMLSGALRRQDRFAALRRQDRFVALYHLDSETINAFSGGGGAEPRRDHAQIDAVYDALGAHRGGRLPAGAHRGGGLPASRLRAGP